MAETFQEKTEQPTEKRLEDAKKKGQVAQSRELTTCLMMLFSSLFLYFTISSGFNEMFKVYVSYVRNVALEITASNIQQIMFFGVIRWFKICMPVFALLCCIAFMANLIQTGFLWSGEALKFNFERINPISGLKRFFSKKGMVEVIKALIKIAILLYIAWSIIIKELPLLLTLPGTGIKSIITYAGETVFNLVMKVSIALLFMAGGDYLFQRWQHKKDLMMTQQEIKEEHKEREGDPIVKSRIRSIQREMARRRMMEDVKKADVVVTNPTTFAVALMYKVQDMPAPMVVAKGAGFIAEKIKGVARDSGVPIVENRPLAQALFYSVKIGGYIPERFYQVVAELLAEIYRIKGKMGL